MTKSTDLIGVDGTSSGWIASIGKSKNRYLSSIKFFEELGDLLSLYPESVIVIDMPIELNKKNYLRKCDVLAKKISGKKFSIVDIHSSVNEYPRMHNLSGCK
jgi:predicted RNase H-like nuclease